MADIVCPFKQFLVLNIETTCQEGTLDYPHEIIQFSVVVIDVNEQIIRENVSFNRFVRPEINTQLTDYCIAKTGVQQVSVNTADVFSDVYREFLVWLPSNFPKLLDVSLLCATPEDLWKKLQYQCLLSRVVYNSFCRQWIDLQTRFIELEGTRIVMDPTKSYLQNVAEHFNVYPAGNIDGMSKCMALARVTQRFLQEGAIMTVNKKLTCERQLFRGLPFGVARRRYWSRDQEVADKVFEVAMPLPLCTIQNYNNDYMSGICPGCDLVYLACLDFWIEPNLQLLWRSLPRPARFAQAAHLL